MRYRIKSREELESLGPCLFNSVRIDGIYISEPMLELCGREFPFIQVGTGYDTTFYIDKLYYAHWVWPRVALDLIPEEKVCLVNGRHEFVNVGFMTINEVCKYCDQEKV